jgi:hypothetical protein
MTALVVIVPIYTRALMDPASGWREDAIEAARQQVEAARPPLARIHIVSRPS